MWRMWCDCCCILIFVLARGGAEKLPEAEINKLLRLANIWRTGCTYVVDGVSYSHIFAPALRSPLTLPQHQQSV